jgi:enoyl-CoA hydratase
MTDTLLFDRRDRDVVVITFNRPDARNALDLATMRAFADRIAALANADTLRALILTGAGDAAFCAGADLVEMSARPTADDAAHMIALMGDALVKMENLPVPVIAAINGYALGGGAEVALACDLRVVDHDVRLGFVQAQRGVIPGWGGGQRLLRAVGYGTAFELLYTARVLDADALAHLRLITPPIAPAGHALDTALSLAQHIAALDLHVIRAMKAMLRAGLQHDYQTALQMERDLFPPLWAGEARIASTQAFLNKGKTNR